MSAPLPVTVIGVGNMGGAMAQRLCALGWTPWVHDIDASKVQCLVPFGALALADIARAATESIATIICVVDANQTREVLFGPGGLAPHLPVGHVVILCPTIGPQDAEDIAAQLATFGVLTLDVIEQSSGQSWIGSDRMRRAIAGDLAPRAHMTLLAKDTLLALDAASQVGFSGPLGAHASAVFAAAVAAGLEGLDDAALLEFLQRPKMAG